MEAKDRHEGLRKNKPVTFEKIPLGFCECTLHCKVIFLSPQQLSDAKQTLGQKYFDAVLMDSKQQMANLKAWNELAEKYHPVLREGCWYLLSSFESLGSSRSTGELLESRELLLLEDSHLVTAAEPRPDTEEMREAPTQTSQKSRQSQIVRSWSSQVLSLKNAIERDKGSFVNTCGLIVSIGNSQFKAVRQGGNSDLRCIYLSDDSVDEPVELVFWKDKCAQVEALRVGEVITVSNVKVGEFVKKNLVIAQTSEISKEAEDSGLVLMLKRAIEAKQAKVKSKFLRTQSRQDPGGLSSGLKSLLQVEAIVQRIKRQKKPIKLTVNSCGWVTGLPMYPDFYFSKCPKSACFRHAKPIDNEKVLCSKCGEVVGKVIHRYIGSCTLVDHSQSLEVRLLLPSQPRLFRFAREDVGQMLFGMQVNELLALYEGAGIVRQHVLHKKLAKRIASRLFFFKLKIILEAFHEKLVLRINLLDPIPLKSDSVVSCSNSLLSSIQGLLPMLAESKSRASTKHTQTRSLHHAE